MNAPVKPHAAALRDALRQRAGEYFPELAGREVTAELQATATRRYSHTFEFALRSGRTEHRVFVKAPRAAGPQCSAAANAPPDRPRLFPVVDVRREAQLEFAALQALTSHLQAIGDARLGAVRVLDLLDGESLVVEALRLPTLDRVIGQAARWRSSQAAGSVAPLFHSAGAWLKGLHTLPLAHAGEPLWETRAEVVACGGAFVEFLWRATGETALLRQLSRSIHRAADERLPRELPLAVAHGDFGLHNLFVTPVGGVIGFDTLAHRQMPPQIDIAYFLLLLETMPPLFASRAWTTRPRALAALRQEFLQGYCGDDAAPPASLPLFELLVALDKWASVVHSAGRARGVAGAVKRARLAWQQRWLTARLRRQLAQLEVQPPATCETSPFAESGARA